MTAKQTGAAGKQRDLGLDNIRALLIFLVVFCHLCELFHGKITDRLYLIIYSFHMPCFLFLSGYFARFNAKKVAKHLLLPYAVFQVLYTLFNCYVLNPGTVFELQFTYPYWIMWYLLALFFCYMLIPLLETQKRWVAAGILVVLTALALLAGTDRLMGFTMTLSRTAVFLPCFFLGHYAGTVFAPGFVGRLRRFRVLLVLSMVGVVVYAVYAVQAPLPIKLLYGSYSYAKAGATPWMRLLTLAGAMAWMLLLICLMPNRKIPVISMIGQRTLPIFLLHGFCQRLLLKYSVFRYTELGNLLLALGLTCAMLLVFSLKPIHWLFRKLF